MVGGSDRQPPAVHPVGDTSAPDTVQGSSAGRANAATAAYLPQEDQTAE